MIDTNNIEVVFDSVTKNDKEVYNLINDVSVASIILIVERNTGVKFNTFKTPTRKRKIVFPRQMCMHFLKLKTKYSLDSIAKIFNKNHTSVIHARKVVQNLIDTNIKIRDMCEKINNEIK